MLSTVATLSDPLPPPRLAFLHGLGRQAHRLGLTAAGSVAHASKHTVLVNCVERIAVMAGWDDESRLAMEDVRLTRGTLTTCWDSYTRDGRVTTEKLWLYLPNDGERRFLGLVSEMTRDEAMAMVMAEGV
jgi:hypothetical protein